MGSPQYNHHFSIKNLPFGIASSAKTPQPQYATRLESTLVFLDELQDTGFFAKVDQLPNNILQQSTLNTYSALPKSVHQHVRTLLQKALSAGNVNELPQNTTEDVENVTTYLPFSIGEFTDLSCSADHSKNIGTAMVGHDITPLIFYRFPQGYSARGSTVVLSDTPITRPNGYYYDETATNPQESVIFGPSKKMDYEAELGIIIGQPIHNPRLLAADAKNHIFGVVSLNDWTARDIQFCKMKPLGPLHGKIFSSSISPWVVTRLLLM